MLILVILIGGLGMIWNPYEFFGAGGLTNSAGCDILRAKTAEPPKVSETTRDTRRHRHTRRHIQYILNNSLYLSHILNNSLYIHLSTIFFNTFLIY